MAASSIVTRVSLRACVVSFFLLTGCAAGPRASLTIPFALRGYRGDVAIVYRPNRDPTRIGFDLLGLPFDPKKTIGFPTFDATVRYDGSGYRAFLGWIQIVTVRDAKSGQEDTSIDQLPLLRSSDTPFMEFGPAPRAFDAPGPNPPRTDERWTAYTFLVYCPDVGRTRRVVPLVAVRWGYALDGGKPTPFAAERVALTEWERLLPVLRERYPSWLFSPRE